MLTKFKLFESNTKTFEEGDLVRFKESNEYGDDNEIYIVVSTDFSNFGNTSNLYSYRKFIEYINNKEIHSIRGTGWIDNDKLEKLGDEEIAAMKYNL